MYLIKPSFEILDFNCSPELIEKAGRTCYKSECKGEPEKFVEMICKRQHESVLEHSFISVKFIVDRGVSHELVRHRLCAFSQESTRYCNYNKKGITYIIPPWFDLAEGEYELDEHHGDYNIIYNNKEKFYNPNIIGSSKINVNEFCWILGMGFAEQCYNQLIKNGQQPQQARSVLPNSLKTEIVTSANVREWMHILKLRCAKTAHPQMQEIMIPLLKEFQERCPVIFNQV